MALVEVSAKVFLDARVDVVHAIIERAVRIRIVEVLCRNLRDDRKKQR